MDPNTATAAFDCFSSRHDCARREVVHPRGEYPLRNCKTHAPAHPIAAVYVRNHYAHARPAMASDCPPRQLPRNKNRRFQSPQTWTHALSLEFGISLSLKLGG